MGLCADEMRVSAFYRGLSDELPDKSNAILYPAQIPQYHWSRSGLSAHVGIFIHMPFRAYAEEIGYRIFIHFSLLLQIYLMQVIHLKNSNII
jgi:hypothetical protein